MRFLLAIFLLVLPLIAQPVPSQSFQLQNGLRVLLLENHQHPLIRLQLIAVWAPLEIRAASPIPGVQGIVPSLPSHSQSPLQPLALGVLDKCSVGNRSRKAFNRAVEERGLSIQLSGGPDGPIWNLFGGSPEAESAFSLLADAATRPILEGGDLDALRLHLIHDLHDQGRQEVARINFYHLLERPDLVLEPITEKSLGQVYLEDLQRSIMATLRPDRAVLAISGDLNLSQARQLTQLNFGTWNEWGGEPISIAAKTDRALACPPLIVPWDRAETTLALPFRATDGTQRAALDLLSLWLPRYLGSNRCTIRTGAVGWRSLILTAEAPETSLREVLLALKKSGLNPKDLEQAKALWNAGRRALALHPQEQLSFAAKEKLWGTEPSEQEIQAVDLAIFNATLQAWLDLDSARVLTFDSEQKPLPRVNQTVKTK